MKLILLLFLIGLLFCCSKNNAISNEYQHLIGEWRNVSGEYSPKIVFQKGGKVNYNYAAKRGYNFKVISTSIGSTFALNGHSWTRLILKTSNEDSALPEISYDSSEFDTLMFEGIKFIKL